MVFRLLEHSSESGDPAVKKSSMSVMKKVTYVHDVGAEGSSGWLKRKRAERRPKGKQVSICQTSSSFLASLG